MITETCGDETVREDPFQWVPRAAFAAGLATGREDLRVLIEQAREALLAGDKEQVLRLLDEAIDQLGEVSRGEIP